VPRIRSIKPDFFTSETIARLDKSARLTFIGLWTYVDDNGVGVLNEMLISAALYPLDSPHDALADLHEDLRSLSGESLVTLFEASGKRYISINSWSEHQKVSHPRNARYPRPSDCDHRLLTSEYGNTPEDFRSHSGDLPERLRPEQGAGSREQGEKNTPASAPPTLVSVPDPAPHPSEAPNRRWSDSQIDADPHFAEFWSAYPRKTDKGHARKAWLKAIRNKVDPALITKGATAYRDDPTRNRDFTAHAATWLNGERWTDQREIRAAAAGRPNPWEL
jgi:hypothetical protein